MRVSLCGIILGIFMSPLGAFVQVVGVALEPDVVYINPSMDVIEHA